MPPAKTVSFTDPYAADYAELARQQKMAELLSQQAAEPIGNTQMVSGWAVPQGSLAGLNKVAQSALAGFMQKKTGDRERMLADKIREGGKKDAADFMSAWQGTPAKSEAFQADTFDQNDQPFGAMSTEKPAVASDRNKALAVALGSGNPMVQSAGSSLLANMLKDPTERFGKIMPHSFTPDSLAQYQQTGNYADLKPIAGGRDFGKVNPGQFTPESLARYAESGQWGDLVQFRAPTIINRGGEIDVLDSGRGTRETLPVVPKLTDTPAYQGSVETAKETAKADVVRATDVTKKTKGADTLIGYIDEAERILNEDKATGSLIGTGYAKLKGAVGKSDASTKANQDLKLISGWMVSNVPRMEGPQSNYDVQNYREMAAMVGDTTIPVGDRVSALKKLRVLQQKYRDIQSGATKPAIDDLWGQ